MPLLGFRSGLIFYGQGLDAHLPFLRHFASRMKAKVIRSLPLEGLAQKLSFYKKGKKIGYMSMEGLIYTYKP